jgi:nitrogen-specific signal transduction histidine kinase
VAAIRYHRFISDTGKIISQINRIKSGDLTTRLNLDDHSDLQEYAENLNSIQSGMSKALEERLASERLKVDLITNVSHDLKTPLTSIISYIDLLKKEELPKQAMEYTEVLSRKADRLKTMIQDIFIVSKAASGNMVVEKELLDLGRLVGQTIADMQEKIDASGLKFRVRHSEEPLLIRSDGQKLYRVLQNLIDNALCYSLKGSRVHIRSWSENNSALVEIKNTSNIELDFTPQEIVERFVRGDASRSGDGSGLGLSIAQTFTEACGGSFNISIDYDDFKVRLAFPLEPKSSAPLFETVMSNASTQSPAPLVTTPHVDTTQASDESQDSPELKNATENPIAVATPVTDSANTLTIEPCAVNDCEVDVNETAGSEETVTTGTTDAAGETDAIDRTDITDTAGEAQTSDNN